MYESLSLIHLIKNEEGQNMSKKLVSLLLAALMMLSCLPVLAEGSVITVTDMHGREITLTEPATRIVAMQPSDCEILCAIGCEDALVGIGQYCDYPASITSLPVVQSGAETNIEEILALNPQVVLMNDMSQTEEQVKQLEENGVRVVVSEATDIEGVYYAIRMIGHLMGRDDNAEAVISDMQTTFEDIRAKSANEGKTVYFEVSPLQWGLWTAGKGTFMDELASICGLTNAFADVSQWASISEEQVLARDPDYIVTITMYYGEGPTPVEEIMSREGWQDLKSVKNAQVFNASDSNALSRPGPRLKDAAIELYNFINGIAEEEAPAA